MKTRKIYPEKIYSSLRRACTYAEVLPDYVQPVFLEMDGLTFDCIGFCVGPAKAGHTWLSYRKREHARSTGKLHLN